MNYTNEHRVKFKLVALEKYYHVAYVSQRTGRQRRLQSFECRDDEMHREMMWILRHTVICTECRHNIGKHGNLCAECRLTRFAKQDPAKIESCMVCYGVVFNADHTRFELVCGHVVCVRCKLNIERISDNLREVIVKCPDCKVKTLVG